MFDVVQTKDGEWVYIDTCYTMDHGWETMVFSCDENGKITDWCDIDVELYGNAEQAIIGHQNIVNKWRELK